MIELARAQNLIIEPTPYDEWWFLVDSDGRCVGEDENAMRLDEIETFLRERAK